MYSETLPTWFWVIYYLFFIATFGTSLFSLVKKKLKTLSSLTLVLTITVPIIGLLGSIGRPQEMDELELFSSQLQQGSIWSIFMLLGYAIIVVWWLLFLFGIETKPKNRTNATTQQP
jgi:uncharacterized membrane protein YhaH (DUF805 family)